MRPLELLLGLFVVANVLCDVFRSVVVPRPTPGFRPAGILARLTWPAWRWVALSERFADRREQLLGSYAPLFLILLLAFWVAGLIVGDGLVLHALRDQIHPQPEDLGTAIYFAAT